jgi:two-component sensor histidine kinase
MAADININSPVANALAMAMVEASTAPLILLDGDLKIVAASPTFITAFGLEQASTHGADVFALGAGEWNVPQLKALLKATVSGIAQVGAYEFDLKRASSPDRRLVVNARRLDYGLGEPQRLLLTVSDITEARVAEKLKDDMLREKAVLLQEIQHRVANSLQIIASVLLLSARRVSSEETRTHLQDAHHRVMSIATLQKQLTLGAVEDVELRSYFTQLCESLGASMIRDHAQQSIQVHVDGSSVTADVSVSLGLIVTELVINALKHAFPDGRKGQILVGYEARGPNWTLSVADNGVGMPDGSALPAKVGLGTSIVEALARQLDARVEVADAKTGVTVSVKHSQIAAVADEEQAAL